MKLQDAVEEFIFHCSVERKLAKNTIDAYRHDLANFKFFLGDRTIGEALTVDSLRRYLAETLTVRGLSASTARRRISCIRALSTYLAKEYSTYNPFKDWAPSIKRPRRLPRALTGFEVSQLIGTNRTLSAIEMETAFCVMMLGATGLRVSELCGVKLSDISSDASAIHVHGKGSRDRIVYISNSTLRQELGKRRKIHSKAFGISAHLLLNSKETPLKPQTLRRRLHKLSSTMGVERTITPHMLRHTAATLLIEAGTDIRFVQRLLGHASIATTEIYTQISDTALKRAIYQADTIGSVMGAT